MPIPKPKKNESRQRFMSRCLGDSTMVDEYNPNQRMAVCATAYEDSKQEGAKRELRDDVFTTQAEAEERAKEIGCSGFHSHEENGTTVFMPCASHDAYIAAEGRDVSGYHEDEDDDDKKKPKKKEDCSCTETKDYETQIQFKADLKMGHEEDEKEEGVFEGYGSVFNNTDLGNDIIRKGAFEKSLRKKGPKGVKMLYQHKSDMPIGVYEKIMEDEKGLYVKGKLALGTQAGKEAYELLKMGALSGLSIGFRTNEKGYHYDKRTRKRIIEEVELMEVSLVTFPMNPKAQVDMVKSEDITIREWENGMRDAFNLSRSEAKVAAKAVHEVFIQRDVEEGTELVDAIKNLTQTLKTL
jgi:HK97 family phage prohead protease